MAKFCGQCGAPLNDDATFCTNCGAPVQQSVNQQQTASSFNSEAVKTAAANAQEKISEGFNSAKSTVETAVKTKDTKTLLIVGGVGVAIIALIVILLCVVLGGGSYKTPLDNFVKVCEKGDGDSLKELLPDSFTDIIDSNKLLQMTFDFDDMAEGINESLIEKYGKNIKVSYKINEKEKLDKDELEDFGAGYIDYFSGLISDDDEDYKVKEGYDLDVTFIIKGKDDEDEEDADITVLKVNGDWVLSWDSFKNLK